MLGRDEETSYRRQIAAPAPLYILRGILSSRALLRPPVAVTVTMASTLRPAWR
jgi:hypothetical protein